VEEYQERCLGQHVCLSYCLEGNLNSHLPLEEFLEAIIFITNRILWLTSSKKIRSMCFWEERPDYM